MPQWFRDSRDIGTIRAGLAAAGMDATGIDGVMGGNWQRFFATSFGPEQVNP